MTAVEDQGNDFAYQVTRAQTTVKNQIDIAMRTATAASASASAAANDLLALSSAADHAHDAARQWEFVSWTIKELQKETAQHKAFLDGVRAAAEEGP